MRRSAMIAMVVLVLISACGQAATSTPTTVPPPTALTATSAPQPTAASQAASLPEVVVYKSPTCSCCAKWNTHLEAYGFKVTVKDTADMTAIKDQYHVPTSARSCHTAVIDGYVVEGHVPAEDIKQLLAMRPALTGLAVPGMPPGSPGMETGGRAPAPFDVLSFDETGATTVFNTHGK